jgi:osmoprotectant transport system substrate-binding protein
MRACLCLALAVALAVSACDSSGRPATIGPSNPATTQRTQLPGTGRPPVTIGDKNFTEQFVLGELYYEALQAEGFSVQLNRNIGPTAVTLQALQSGRLGMYPEYLNVWNASVAGYKQTFASSRAAYRAAERWAAEHALELLNPTPFSDTEAVGVTFNYAQEHGLHTVADLGKVSGSLIFGAPPQFQQQGAGLTALEQAYGFQPAAFKALEIGQQYQALDQGTVQAADVNTTDGQLTSGFYTLLRDPLKVLGWGNVVPVVTAQTLAAEGPAFADTINRVSALLTLSVIRELNAQVDLSGVNPATVAKDFLIANGVISAGTR